MRQLTALLFMLCSLHSYAQIHCAAVNFEPNVPVATNFVFDTFSQFESGMTINNAATLRVRVEDQVIPDPDCRWFLTMEVNNSPGNGTNTDEWETLVNFGSGNSPTPTLDILEIRIRNACQTSPLDGVFQTFNNNGDFYEIIENTLLTTPAGSCSMNVNGPGNHLANYNEYTFAIDIRVRPGYTFSPGVYELSIRFHIEEQL
ncbi:MAG: hypothetical protein AB8B53_15075 [Flavobacteriales bacterium]